MKASSTCILLLLFAIGTGLVGCTGPIGAQEPVVSGSPPASGPALDSPVDLPAVPVDASLTPVSRTAPSADAKAAMDLCLRPGEISLVSGMAQLPARDVRHYMLTNGREPVAIAGQS